MVISIIETGKYTSVRHEQALQDGKLTAGQAAKLISKKVGEKVYAKDIRSLSTEWHHSGFYSNGMGKTWFFTFEQIEDIIKNWEEIKNEFKVERIRSQKEIDEKKNTQCVGFYFEWNSDYGGNYGRKRNFKVLRFFEGNELERPQQNFTDLRFETQNIIDKVKENVGRRYFGWDEPQIKDFENI